VINSTSNIYCTFAYIYGTTTHHQLSLLKKASNA
jgi:hypothetical protein